MPKFETVNKLYIGDSVKHPGMELFKLRLGKVNPFLFLVCVPEGPNSLEIVNSYIFKQKLYNDYTIKIAGLAMGYQEAVELVSTIASDAYSVNKDCNLKNYILNI